MTTHKVSLISGKDQGGPLYFQIASLLRQRIQTGHWKPGEQLPTLDKLAKEFSVALVTVRQAISVLEQDGLIWRKQGKGTFVANNGKIGRWIQLRSDWNSLLHHLEGKEAKLLNMENDFGVPALSPDEGLAAPNYRYMRRIHSCEGVPYALIDIYLDARIYRMAADRFDSGMVIPVLESLPQVDIRSVRQTITFGIADLETAALLNVSANSPVGEVRRVILDKDGCTAYVAETKYRGDFVKLEVNMER